MTQKKIMLLGGLRYLKPVIDAAHKQGYYVITADYLPNNIAHKWSDEYCNVSIIDKDAVLKEALRLHIDGIMSFACDPGVLTASYVQEKMGLPSFGPFESVEILQNKDKFRAFLQDNDFYCPWSFGITSWREVIDLIPRLSYPLIVKPTDSAGSKGVTRVNEEAELKPAIEKALEISLSGKAIIEEFLEKVGCSSDSECFTVDGKLCFVSYSAQRFDEEALGPYTPAAFSWPSTMGKEKEDEITSELQRLLSLLKMKTSLYNVECRIGADGKAYLMEVSPRGGGNRLAEMIKYSTGEDLITAITRYCVGDKLPQIVQREYVGHWAEVILHSDKDGFFDGLLINKDMLPYVIERDLWVKEGDRINGFRGANDSIGTLVLNFETKEMTEIALASIKDWLIIKVR